MSRTPPDMSERGFVLVGVVMFILVLTILGLSLFSLTGYEAQFMQQSTDHAESFQAAAGGLDRARFALAKMGHLENVKDNLPLNGVVYAVARREANGDTVGPIGWSNPDYGNILIRVKAVKNGQTHFLEAKFNPSRAPSLYKRLFSLSATGMPDSSGLRVIQEDPAELTSSFNWQTTWLYGECRQNDANNPDMIYRYWSPPQSTTLALAPTGGVPTPEVDTYFNDHWASASEVNYPNGGPKNFDLDALSSPDSVGFFRSSWTGGDWSFNFSLADQPGNNFNKFDPRITVHGTAVWMFDRGLRSEGTVSVQGSGHANDMLVLIAKPSSDPGGFDLDGPGNVHRSLKGAGIALLGSITSTVPVILVSSGGVLLENRDFGLAEPSDGDDAKATNVSCLSVFAPYARVMGPDHYTTYSGANTQTLVFRRNASAPIDPRIDRLSDLGDLPNTAAGLKGKLSFLAGTWREVDETTPP